MLQIVQNATELQKELLTQPITHAAVSLGISITASMNSARNAIIHAKRVQTIRSVRPVPATDRRMVQYVLAFPSFSNNLPTKIA